MRIISGKFKGRKLSQIKGTTIRPTADRVREAIFNILAQKSDNQILVLDLFAGSGALGIEALSRGACQAVFIDHQKAAIELIQHNLKLCDLQARVIHCSLPRGLDLLTQTGFNLVFMDPPYQQDYLQPTLQALACTDILADKACLVIESGRNEIVAPLKNFQVMDMRKYGKTKISFLSYLK